MALNVVTAGDGAVASSVLITAFPFTVGFWTEPSSFGAGTGGAWALFNQAGGTSDNLQIRLQNGGATWDLVSTDAAATADTNSAGVPVQDAWSFILARIISTSSRQFAVLNPDGSVSTATGTITVATDPTVFDNHQLGNTTNVFFYAGGAFAEFWYTLTDVQPDGGVTQDALIRQLAYGGPFSVPSIGPSVVQYRSFRETASDSAGEADERYDAPIAQGVLWNANGAPIIGAHPPLPYWYKRPTEDISGIGIV